mgnify:CR=1 FL=1
MVVATSVANDDDDVQPLIDLHISLLRIIIIILWSCTKHEIEKKKSKSKLSQTKKILSKQTEWLTLNLMMIIYV